MARTRRQIDEAAPREEEFTDEIDLLELFFRLIENFKIILASGLFIAILMGIYSYFIATPIYEATSQMYVLSSRDSAINLSDLQIGASLTNDYEEVLYTWEVQSMVRQNLNLPYTNEQLSKMVSVSNPSDTRILKITVRSKDPQEAKDIADEYISVASDYISDVMLTDAPTVLSAAQLPRSPVSPRKFFNVALGFIVGCLIAVILIVVVFVMDDKIKTADDIRRYTGLPTLAVVARDPEAIQASNSSMSSSKGRRRGANS